MEMKSFKTLRHALCAAVTAAAVTANAATYYWYGSESDDPLDPGNYHVALSPSSDVLTVLPAAGDTVQVLSGGYCIRFDDGSVAYLASLRKVQVKADSRCVIDVSTNSTVNAALCYSAGQGTVVKRGGGTLTLTATGENDYDTSFVVEEGDLVFPQSGLTSNNCNHGGLVVSNGCNVVLDGGLATTTFTLTLRGGMSGDGNVAYTNATKVCTLQVSGTMKELFSGVLSGENLKLHLYGDLMLANTANTFAYGGANALSLKSSGTLGFRKFGTKSAEGTSSFGKLNAEISLEYTYGSRTFLNLATEADGAQTGNRNIRDYSGATTTTFDGGAYGNFTYRGTFGAYGANMRELVLAGAHANECTFNAGIYPFATSRYYLTKRGTGTWVLPAWKDDSDHDSLAGIGVENGTLKFMSLREQGQGCSLGKAPSAYLFGYALKDTIANVANSNKVDYAIRLGNVRDLSEEGTLDYAADADGSCTNRKIAVTGRGRLKNSAIKYGSHKAISWTGVKSVVPPEDAALVPVLSTLTLDCVSTGKSTLTNIAEDVGAAPLRIAKEGAGSWTLGGTLAFTGGIDVREGSLNVGTMASSLPYLRVDSGATLNMTGDAATANGFAIDVNEGVGTISGVAFAPSGTIGVTNAVSFPIAVACDLSGCSGVENLSNWTVTINGKANAGFAIVTTSGIRISKKGLLISYR